MLLLGLAASRWVRGDFANSILTAVLAGILILTGYVISHFRARQTEDEERRQRSLDALRTQQQKLRDSIGIIEQEIEASNTTIGIDALILSLNPPVKFDDLRGPEINLASEIQLASDWKALNLRLQEAEETVKRANARATSAAENVKNAENQTAALQDKWNEWKRELGIEDLRGPGAILDFFQQLEKARDQLKLRNEALVEQQGFEGQIADWEKRSRILLLESGLQLEENVAGENLVEAITRLQERCANDSSTRKTITELGEQIAAQERKLARAVEGEKQQQEKLEMLFKEVCVANEEAFRTKYATFKKCEELKRRIHQCETQLTARLGRGEEAEALRIELAIGDVHSWEKAVQDANSEIPKCEASRDEAIRALERSQLEGKEIEQSSDLVAKNSDIASLQEEFATAVREWRIIMLSKGLIEETLRTYTATRQPQVLSFASDSLSAVTNGVYVKVLQDYQSQNLIIVDKGGRHKAPDELSRGTAELLYLCLRLGLAAEFGGHGAALPLIMDDVLVNFDPERAALMISLLTKFVSMSPVSGQVLIFTCHPETTEVIKKASPDCKIIELERFGIPKPSLATGNS